MPVKKASGTCPTPPQDRGRWRPRFRRPSTPSPPRILITMSPTSRSMTSRLRSSMWATRLATWAVTSTRDVWSTGPVIIIRLVPRLLLSPTLDLGSACRLQPVDRLELRNQLQQRSLPLHLRLRRRLWGRLVGTRRLPAALCTPLCPRRLPQDQHQHQHRRHQHWQWEPEPEH